MSERIETIKNTKEQPNQHENAKENWKEQRGGRKPPSSTIPMANKQCTFLILMETRLLIMKIRKIKTFYSIKIREIPKKLTQMDGSKSMGRKISFAAVLTYIIRRGALLEEAFIHTAEMTEIKIIL